MRIASTRRLTCRTAVPASCPLLPAFRHGPSASTSTRYPSVFLHLPGLRARSSSPAPRRVGPRRSTKDASRRRLITLPTRHKVASVFSTRLFSRVRSAARRTLQGCSALVKLCFLRGTMTNHRASRCHYAGAGRTRHGRRERRIHGSGQRPHRCRTRQALMRSTALCWRRHPAGAVEWNRGGTEPRGTAPRYHDPGTAINDRNTRKVTVFTSQLASDRIASTATLESDVYSLIANRRLMQASDEHWRSIECRNVGVGHGWIFVSQDPRMPQDTP